MQNKRPSRGIDSFSQIPVRRKQFRSDAESRSGGRPKDTSGQSKPNFAIATETEDQSNNPKNSTADQFWEEHEIRQLTQGKFRSRKIKPTKIKPLSQRPLPKVQKGPTKTVSIEIKIPKLPSMPKIKAPKFTRRIKTFTVLAVVTTGLLAATALGLKGKLNHTKTGNGPVAVVAKPDFKPVVPLDKPNITEVLGTSSTYDPEKQVLSFSDTYFNQAFTISQQKLPDNLKSNPEEVKKLVASLGSSHEIQTHKGVAYIALNPKTKQETAVFLTSDLLLFIRTARHTEDDIWKEYINKLKVE